MAYKLKIGPSQGLKLKGQAGFALPMVGGVGIGAAKSGGIWTVSLDYEKMPDVATVNDDTAYVLTWDSATGLFTRLNVTDMKAEFEGTFDGYYQPLDATLTALAALDSTAGLLVQTGADTFERRTLTGTANEITVTDGAGTAGNPTVSLPAAMTFTGKTVTGGTFESPTIKINGNTLAASAGTATVTIPNATDTLVGRDTTDTLANKTISGASNTLSNIGNSSLTNSSMTIAGHLVVLGGTQAIEAADLSNGTTGTGAVVLAASPALTGTPTAPTASPSDNSTKIATTAYVDAQVAGGVAGVASLNGQTGALAIAVPPQGRLTLTSGVAITTSDVTGATSIYFTPSAGNQVPIYNGTNTVPTTFSELTLALDSDSGHTGYQQAGKNFDLYAINDSGTIRLGTGPAWSSDTARGTGAGTTELELKNGIWTNKNTITIRFGSVSGNTVSVSANQATYVGSIRTTANGQTEDSMAKRFVYNAYNQAKRQFLRNDATASWSYSTASFRQANNSSSNQVAYLAGLVGSSLDVSVMGIVVNSTSTYRVIYSGIGIDSTSVNSGTVKEFSRVNDTQVAGVPKMYYTGYAQLGYHYIAWLEKGAGADTQTWIGTEASDNYKSGIWGGIFQ